MIASPHNALYTLCIYIYIYYMLEIFMFSAAPDTESSPCDTGMRYFNDVVEVLGTKTCQAKILGPHP